MLLQDKLKLARNSLGKTQIEMAKAIGISKRAWQTYEEGTSIPGGKIFASLTNIGFNAHWFFSDNDSVPMIYCQNTSDDFISTNETARGKQTNKPLQQEEVNIQDLLNMTAEVLVSNTLYRPALAANIKAFHRSIALEQDNKELRNRVDLIEEKLEKMDKILAEHNRLAQENAKLKARLTGKESKTAANS